MPNTTDNTSTAALSPDTVAVPAALQVLLRAPENALPYSFRHRLADSWAGVRDRRIIPDEVQKELNTDWLAGLTAECRTRQEDERRITRAALAVLDDEIAHASERIVQAGIEIDRLTSELDFENRPVEGSATTSAEEWATPEELMARRAREQRARVVRLRGRIAALQSETADCHERITAALAGRRSHWAQLIVRATHLDAHYRRRARRYLRAATRRTTPASQCSELSLKLPSWANPDAIPVLATD